MDFPILIIWMSSLLFLGASEVFFFSSLVYFSMKIISANRKAPDGTPRRIWRRPIWDYCFFLLLLFFFAYICPLKKTPARLIWIIHILDKWRENGIKPESQHQNGQYSSKFPRLKGHLPFGTYRHLRVLSVTKYVNIEAYQIVSLFFHAVYRGTENHLLYRFLHSRQNIFEIVYISATAKPILAADSALNSIA